MSKTPSQNCLLCRSRKGRVVLSYNTPDRFELAVGVSHKGYWRHWVKCEKCGLYYSIFSRPKNILNKVYTSAYRSKDSLGRTETPEEIFKKIIALPKGESETKFRVDWLRENIKIIQKSNLFEGKKARHKMLDVGGGSGVFAYEFKDQDWKTHVIDPSRTNNFIRTKLKIPLIQKFYQPGLFGHKFDLISAIYVLEHVANPIQFLKKMRKDLVSGGLLYIEVPDSFTIRYKTKNDDILLSHHLFLFNPMTLTKLFEMTGFELLAFMRLKTLRGHYGIMALTRATD